MSGMLLRLRLFFSIKFVWVGLAMIGVIHWGIGVLMAIGGLAMGYSILRKGLGEQYLVTPREQNARFWEDLVWSHSTWVNPDETPKQAIKRLAGPWQGPASPAPQPVLQGHRAVLAAGPVFCRYCPSGTTQCSGHGVQRRKD